MKSKQRILFGALDVFAEKGFHGARVEEIGAKSEINKAMVYYYYSNKENLYQEVINMTVKLIYSEIIKTMQEHHKQMKSPVDVLIKFVDLHYSAFSKNQKRSRLFMDVLNNRPEYLPTAFVNAFENENIREHELIEQSFQEGVNQGIFRDIDFKQLFISIIGMNLIYFLAQPIAEFILDLDIEDEKPFLKNRKESIIDLLLRGVLVDNTYKVT